MTPHTDDHLDALRMQAYLDGELPAGEVAGVRSHLDACPRCRSEAEAWTTLFGDLAELPSLEPSPAFRERIMASVEGAAPARRGVRSLVGRRSRAGSERHVPSGRLQDVLEGTLAARSAARVEDHLAGCAVCRSELAAFRELGIALSSLPRHAPSPGFAEGVMAGLRVEQMARVAMSPTSRLDRALAAARRWGRSLVPSSGQGWAAALGLAMGPAVVVAVVVQAIFAHPLVTPSNLASFLVLQLQELASGAAALLTRPAVAAVVDALSPLVQSPALLAALVTGLSGLTVAAAWTLYRTVFSSPLGEISDARALR
jgi:anti-sigma factor RsiW